MHNPAGFYNSKKLEMFNYYAEDIPEPLLLALLEEFRKSVKLKEVSLHCFRLPLDAAGFLNLAGFCSTLFSFIACIFWKMTLKDFCISFSKSMFFSFALVLMNFFFERG